MKERQQSTTTYPLVFLLVSSTDHISGVTGANVTVTLSKNGGAFGAASGTVTEVGNGWYKLGGSGLATDLGTLGPLVLHATATGADPTDSLFTVVPWNPFNAVNMGLSALVDPWLTDVVAGSGSTYTGNAAGKILSDWRQGSILTAVNDGSPAAGSFKLGSGAASTDSAYVGQSLTFITGTLAGQRRTITAYNGATKLATFTTAFTAAPANADVCEII